MRPFAALVLIVLVLAARPAAAEPAFGQNCLSCHSVWLSDALTIVGADTTADPDESYTGAPDRGELPTFTGYLGSSRALRAAVGELLPGDTYAVTLYRLRYSGVESDGMLHYGADCDWAQWGESAHWYSDPVIFYSWGDGPSQFAYQLDIEPSSDLDYYDLVLGVAGRLADTNELFYCEEHFYLLLAESNPGDCNCDGVINAFDIDAFVLALTDAEQYATQYPDCPLANADANGDGVVNVFDIDPFVQLLTPE